MVRSGSHSCIGTVWPTCRYSVAGEGVVLAVCYGRPCRVRERDRMNFNNMLFLNESWGFWFALALMGATIGIMWFFFRKVGWF